MTAPPPSPDHPAWHCLDIQAAARELKADPHAGLSQQEAALRLEQYGRNELESKRGRTPLQMLADQFKDVMIWVLLAAVGVSVLLGEVTDAVVIVAIIVLNTALGVVQES